LSVSLCVFVRRFIAAMPSCAIANAHVDVQGVSLSLSLSLSLSRASSTAPRGMGGAMMSESSWKDKALLAHLLSMTICGGHYAGARELKKWCRIPHRPCHSIHLIRPPVRVPFPGEPHRQPGEERRSRMTEMLSD
jgi:hypothetical protein